MVPCCRQCAHQCGRAMIGATLIATFAVSKRNRASRTPDSSVVRFVALDIHSLLDRSSKLEEFSQSFSSSHRRRVRPATGATYRGPDMPLTEPDQVSITKRLSYISSKLIRKSETLDTTPCPRLRCCVLSPFELLDKPVQAYRYTLTTVPYRRL